jgi:NOL1/NOP2/fmu family ribosome biogenesis protein
VLVDAPCSGEGMFRRHPETRTEWTTQTPAGCLRRQAEILVSCAEMVRDGGILCYSTCTFNTVENEGAIESFLLSHPEFSLQPFVLPPDLMAENGMLHLFPHKVAGEGHFVALMKKRGVGMGDRSIPKKVLPLHDKESLEAYHSFCLETFGEKGPEPTGLFAGRLISIQALPDISGLKVLRAGLHLGQPRGRHFIPDHAFAMSGLYPESCRTLPMTLVQAEAYLRGETLPAPDNSRGWAVMQLAGLPLGWGKIAEGRVQNHYPKGLRKG